MNQQNLEKCLKDLPLGGIHFFPQIPSTNAEAANWIEQGCHDLALVVADAQTAGRGRGERRWFTPAGSALAFSIVLRAEGLNDQLKEHNNIARLNGLGALAVCHVLQKKYQLPAKIKWPNDVLVEGRKLSGVLVESQWIGSEFIAAILGVGINVATTSVPPSNWDQLNPDPYPATCVETVLGAPVDRWDLFHELIEELLIWHKQLSKDSFLQAWQQNLAFLGEWVRISVPGVNDTIKLVRIIALDVDGALQIQDKSGELSSLQIGEIHPFNPLFGGFTLRPVDSTKK